MPRTDCLLFEKKINKNNVRNTRPNLKKKKTYMIKLVLKFVKAKTVC